MKVLVDTQCFLWMAGEPEALSSTARDIIESGESDLFLSAASAWEISIKYPLGKLRLPRAPAAYLPEAMMKAGVVSLPITAQHALRVADLPPHHRDPFDRMLVAQAQVEGLALLTSDVRLRAYDVEVVRA